ETEAPAGLLDAGEQELHGRPRHRPIAAAVEEVQRDRDAGGQGSPEHERCEEGHHISSLPLNTHVLASGERGTPSTSPAAAGTYPSADNRSGSPHNRPATRPGISATPAGTPAESGAAA